MQIKSLLSEDNIPSHYYNILSDLKEPLPPVLHPGTKEPVGPDDLSPLFPMELIKQEVSTDPQIIIPDQVRDIYRLYRHTPLDRARSLGEAVGATGKVF